MAYICHCDICDTKIEGGHTPHAWYLGETKDYSLPPAPMMLCDTCFVFCEKEKQVLLHRVQERRETIHA